MYIDYPTEMQYNQQEYHLEQHVSACTAQIMDLYPQLLLGDVRLFDYNSSTKVISLTPAFHDLLKLLVSINELNPAVLKVSTLQELNSLLQQSQGVNGGLVRKPGTERWDLQDSPDLQKRTDDLQLLFQRLGIGTPRNMEHVIDADHCIVFGALVSRMEKRIEETIAYLQNNVKIKGHLYLLGSNRPILEHEVKHIQSKCDLLTEERKNYWNNIFANNETAIESQALECLWECLVPKNIQAALKEKLIVVTATRIGYSYRQYEGHRPTTESTTEEWTKYFKDGQPQTIFAVIELPYTRMTNQLRATVLTDSRKASSEMLLDRIKHTQFYFAFPILGSTPLLTVVLDEIGRNVYHIVDLLDYLESLPVE